MSFKEFDMSEYFNALEDFKNKNTEEVIHRWGSIDEYNKMLETFKSKEQEIAKMAIKQYGSIEKYTQAMKKNLTKMNNLDTIKDNVSDYMKKTEELYQKLTADLTIEVNTKEIQDIVNELVISFNEFNPRIDMGENFWELAAEGYLSSSEIIDVTDKKYGTGASEYIGKALRAYFV